MLSRDCDGCSQLKGCSKRFNRALKGDKVYCPDGTAHLVDEASEMIPDMYLAHIEAFQ
jgi:hypothetical protein